MRNNDDIYATFSAFRSVLNESEERAANDNNGDAVPYTMQDEAMRSITDVCRSKFGADFSQSKTPMLYLPDTGDGKGDNVVLTGRIPSLGNATFQFVYKDAHGGCYVLTNPINLNDESLSTLNVIYGVFKNWKNEIGKSGDYKPMSLQNDTDEDYTPSIPSGNA